MIFGLESFTPWLVWLFPILSGFMVPLFDRLGSKARNSFATACGFVTLLLASSMIVSYYFGELPYPQKLKWIPVVGIDLGFYLDPLSILFANLIALMGLIVLIYSLSYMAHEEGLSRYYSFMLFFIGSMIGLIMADNFLQMFLFWELVGLCSYALVSFWFKRPEAVKAGTKVFLMTKVGDVALLAGIILLYANMHTLSYRQVFEQCGTVAKPMFTTISLLFLFGSLAKSAQLPLHTWLYSAMEAPTSVSCLLHGATMVKGGVYLIARTHVMFSSIPLWLNSVAWTGIATALIGATLALQTQDIKGVQAYSTMSQNGFMLLAFGAASSPSDLGWFAGIYHMFSHAFFQGLGFLAVGGIVHELGTRDMREMGGLRKVMPITFSLYMITTLSRSGIPPFSGFFSKGLIAESVVTTGNIALIFLMCFASVLTFAYSYRSIALVFAGEGPHCQENMKIHEVPVEMSASASVLGAGCFFLGFVEEALAHFFGFNYALSGESTLWLEPMMLAIVLLLGGLPTYLIYQKKTLRLDKLRGGILAPFDLVLQNGYFFDFIYEKIARGFVGASSFICGAVESKAMARFPYAVSGMGERLAHGVLGFVEIKILGALPELIAVVTVKLSHVALVYFDASLDRLTTIATDVVSLQSHKIRRMDSFALPRYVLAAALGLLLLCVLLLINFRG